MLEFENIQRLVLLPGATRLFRNDDVITTAAHDTTFNQFIQVLFEIDDLYPKCRRILPINW